MFAAGVWVAAGGRGSRFDRQEELWGGLLFAAFGLLALYVVIVVWGQQSERHPRLRGVTLSLTSDRVRRGDELSVVVTGRMPDMERLELGLICDERSDTEVHTNVAIVHETAETTVLEEWQVVPTLAVEATCTFRVPPASPYSYEGDCVSFAWRIAARAARAGQPDARLEEPIWVEP